MDLCFYLWIDENDEDQDDVRAPSDSPEGGVTNSHFLNSSKITFHSCILLKQGLSVGGLPLRGRSGWGLYPQL